MSEVRLTTRPDSVLEDPGALAVATLYARSYLSGALQSGNTTPEEELGSFVDDVLAVRPDFSNLLLSDSLGREDKLAIVERVVVPKSSEYFANFLRVLIRHGRLDMLPLIRQVLSKVQEEAAGKRQVRVKSAKPLSNGARSQICEQLKNKLGFDPVLHESVDASLIGGLVLQVGDTVYDSSLRSRLKQLKGRLVEKALNEIQSGRDRFSHPEGD